MLGAKIKKPARGGLGDNKAKTFHHAMKNLEVSHFLIDRFVLHVCFKLIYYREHYGGHEYQRSKEIN